MINWKYSYEIVELYIPIPMSMNRPQEMEKELKHVEMDVVLR